MIYLLTRLITLTAVSVMWFQSLEMMFTTNFGWGLFIFICCAIVVYSLFIEQLNNLRTGNTPF